MARRTKEEAKQTRHIILESAERLFFEQGVARTTLEEIARAAGVTRGAVYWHFRNKADLFEALQVQVRLPKEDAIRNLLSQADEQSLQSLSCMLTDVLQVMATDVRRRRVFTILFHRCEYVEEMRVIVQRMHDHLEQLLEQSVHFFEMAMRRGELSPHWSPAAAAFGLHGLMLGLLTRMLESDDATSSLALAQECVMSFFESIAAASTKKVDRTGFAGGCLR